MRASTILGIMVSNQTYQPKGGALMNIVTLAERFVLGLLDIQENFTEDLRLDKLEESAVDLGNQILSDFISLTLTEADQLICDSGLRKRGYTIQRHDTRTLITTTGDATFTHTLFRSRKDGTYHFLLDELMGLPDHERLSEQAEAKLLIGAESGSYQRAADLLQVGDQKISKVTVMKKVHALLEHFPEDEIPEEKRECRYLYVEADEDHIHEQGTSTGGRGFLGKLIYLYEGKEDVCSGKRQLIRPFYRGGLYQGREGNQKLWESVQNYIDMCYDSDYLKQVYISGDGANWIKAGADHVNKSVLVADRFHLMKYINRVANLAQDESAWVKGRLYKYIYQDKLLSAKRFLTKIEKIYGGEEAVEACRAYFVNNWDGIQRAFHDKKVYGCSAEGHVSHLYSDRMSSRPMGWSKAGSDAMCQLRCYTRNHGKEKIISIVRYRRQKEMEALPATGTDGMIAPETIRKKYTKSQQEVAAYWERMQASIGGTTAKKILMIRQRLNDV